MGRASPEHGDEQIDQHDVGHEQEDDKEEHYQPVGIERDAGARLGPGWARPEALFRRAVDMFHEGHCKGGHSEMGPERQRQRPNEDSSPEGCGGTEIQTEGSRVPEREGDRAPKKHRKGQRPRQRRGQSPLGMKEQGACSET